MAMWLSLYKKYKFRQQEKTITIVTVLLMLAIASCQKVVNIDLNDASPRIVIEGIIDNSPGPYRVKLTKSGSYFNQPVLPPVSGAQVIISDNTGTIDTLTEDSTGIYFAYKIKGIPGHSYTLTVVSDNVMFTGKSTMMSVVNIDSVGVEIVQRVLFGLRNRRDSSLTIHFRDPADEKNFYRIKFIEKMLYNPENYRLYDDAYTNGEAIDLRVGRAVKGDTDRIELISIDRAAYDYYRTLEDILRINPIFGSTPANPNTNLNNGALGYFAAIAITRKSIIIH
jgi:hypothetical protein